MDDSEDGQRRIELASPKDFAFLIANVRAAAAEHLHAAFPPQSDGGEDELRNEIEAIVDDYIDRTFTLAAPNLSINGLPVDPADFFKPASRSSGRKSSIPPVAPDDSIAYEPFDADKRQRVAELVSQEEQLLEQVAAMKRAVPADRQEGVEERFRGAVGALGRLKRDMPSVVAKMERARVAGEYVRDGR
ncbi:hypothetical protein LEL_04149 [Akanthomyces lecanii RCEF 1005]|uniref:Kinetochore Mis14 n=1 Tax=Akanthomyces lecanii RCEF 1005 TaxID=1081108 RepID=A0A168H5E9_CORDF|nr:hypothetical protein LEL_04149 [Akanthomyces lecanii RCEF 1005]